MTATKGELILFSPFFKLKFLMKICRLRLNLIVKSLAFCVCTHMCVGCVGLFIVLLCSFTDEKKRLCLDKAVPKELIFHMFNIILSY